MLSRGGFTPGDAAGRAAEGLIPIQQRSTCRSLVAVVAAAMLAFAIPASAQTPSAPQTPGAPQTPPTPAAPDRPVEQPHSPGPPTTPQPVPPAPPPGAPGAAEQRPAPGALIAERKPVISVVFPAPIDPASVLLEVDGVDVTMLARIEGNRLIYVPSAELSHGERTVKVTANDTAGTAMPPLEWKFKVRRFAFLEDASLGGELSNTYEGAVRKPIKEPSPGSGISHKTETPVHNFQNNLAVRGLLKEGDFSAKLDSNIRYIDEFRPRARPKSTTDKLDIANYLINVEKQPLTFELGDIAVNEGFYGAPSLSRRGMHVLLKQESIGAQLHLFGTRYESTQGHDPFFGVEDSESILYGFAASYAPFQNRELLRIHGMNVRGHRYSSAPGSNVGTIVAGERGDLWSLGTTSTFLGGKVKLLTEIAFSEFDQNVTDEFTEQSDKAYRTRLEGGQDVMVLLGAPLAMRWGAEYSYVGLNFRSPGNPGGQPDREGYNVKTDLVWKIATLSTGYSFFNDNTDRLELLPRVRTWTFANSLTLAPQGLPQVSLTHNVGDQRSMYEPETFGPKRIDNFQNTYGLTSSWGSEKLNVSVGGSYNRFDDNTVTLQAGNKDTWTAQATVSVKPFPELSVSPGFSYNEIAEHHKNIIGADNTIRRGLGKTQTMTGTMTVAYDILPKKLNWDLNLSGASAQSSDDTQDNQTWSGMSRLTWNVGKLFTDFGRQAVSLRVNWNRTVDHVVPRDTNNIGVFLILDLLSPFNF